MPTTHTCRRAGRRRRREERVTALGAKEVHIVIRPFAEFRVVERDEAFVDYDGLAVIAPGRKTLETRISCGHLRLRRQGESERPRRAVLTSW